MRHSRTSWLIGLVAAVLAGGVLYADYGLKTVAPWRAESAKRFSVDGGVIRADGELFPLTMDFTWSAPHNNDFLRYDVQLLGTAHYMGTPIKLEGKQDWRGLDAMLEMCRRNRIYFVVGLSVANQDGYLNRHPEARMMGPKGAKVHRRYVCFLDPGYRKALGKALSELAQHLRDQPYALGYYPQDEFSYPGFGGYSETSVGVFRKKIIEKYGGLAALNAAWKTTYKTPDDIEPPQKPELGVRWADWQEFRRWAYFDFTSFVYRTLKKNDPNHLVVWSLDFWGSSYVATNWWEMPRCSDVLMRHGIGYRTGTYRFQLVREIAEGSKKPGSALAMPPGFYPPYEQFSLLLDASRTGISYVCAGGSDEHTYYRGAADSDRGYQRREPGYTTSRSVNQLVHLLGETYLLSERRRPQIGYFIGDRTSWMVGVDRSQVNGILNLLGDINVDYAILSEHNAGDLSGFKTLVAGPEIQLASGELVQRIEKFVRAGGGLILMPGAFERDEKNVPVQRPTFDLFEGRAAPVRSVTIGKTSLTLDRRTPVRPLKKDLAGEALAMTDKGVVAAGKVRVGKGEVLAVGWYAGRPYGSAWVKDFTGLAEKENVDAVEDNAYANMRPERAAEGAVSLLPQRAVAVLFRDFARARGARASVQCAGYEDAVAALRCRSFRRGKDYLVGIANRMVKPGQKFADTWPADYHVSVQDLDVRLQLDKPAEKLFGVLMPLARPMGDGWSAVPSLLEVRKERDLEASFTLPRLDDAAMVVVSPDYRPVLGAATDRRSVVPGEQVTLTAQIINPGTKPVSGTLLAEGDPDAIVATEESRTFRIPPGGSFQTRFPLSVPKTTLGGYYLTQAVARLDDGRVIRSPSLEVRVVSIYELSISPEDQTIYPDSKVGNSIVVSVRTNTKGVRGRLDLAIEGGRRFTPDTRQKALVVDGSRDRYSVAFAFATPEQTHVTETTQLKVTGRIGDFNVDETREIRLARGTVTYKQRRKVRLSNARPTESVRDLVVLENDRIKIRIIPQIAVVHDLVLRETNNDLLREGTYPFGLVWYAWKGGWRLVEMSESGATVHAKFAGRSPDGKPVTMSATLNDGDRYTSIVYDASASGPVNNAFYLMSRLGRGGSHASNEMHIPTGRGMIRRQWRRHRSFRKIPGSDMAEPWLAVVDPKNDQVFSVSYRFDHLREISVSSGSASFNYMVFYPEADQPPGKITFRLAGQMGGIAEAQKLQRELIEKAGR